ncbi:uncharacterized protein LOC143259685 [Megalopta genalis]|uniref:uncharacterized protein LOC143259685 n=1 Tax=Megalopta genalis TaxID=115081 RepID=UPI003FD4AEC2
MDAPRTSSSRSTNLRLDFEKSALCLKSLRPTGDTPKLSRKLLVSDLDTPSFYRKVTKVEVRTDDKDSADAKDREKSVADTGSDRASNDGDDVVLDSPGVLETCSDSNATKRSDGLREDRIEHKVKRSESYRMANSPIMFIRKFSSTAEKSSKISRTPSEELQEELLKESINYPETVSSPEPRSDGIIGFNAEIAISVSKTTVPKSPRPRATDIQPARVLKYSGNDTEIW